MNTKRKPRDENWEALLAQLRQLRQKVERDGYTGSIIPELHFKGGALTRVQKWGMSGEVVLILKD
jgi:hypothetical protein